MTGTERIDGYRAAMNGHRFVRQTRVLDALSTEHGDDTTRKLLSSPETVMFWVLPSWVLRPILRGS